jgi:hypothetical protein
MLDSLVRVSRRVGRYDENAVKRIKYPGRTGLANKKCKKSDIWSEPVGTKLPNIANQPRNKYQKKCSPLLALPTVYNITYVTTSLQVLLRQ